MSETIKASDLYPDVLELCQKISDLTKQLIAGVDTLDGNNWQSIADDLVSINEQLQNMLVAAPESTESSY